VRTLPYQPLATLRQSLSAADVHLVSIGTNMVGIVHPCKIYGAMALGRPVVVLGPRESHLADLVVDHDVGWQVAHGDVDGAAELIERLATIGTALAREKGLRAQQVVETHFSKARLCGALCDAIEQR
jgi:glycosyltransferase involved in cell wall biosynthesis